MLIARLIDDDGVLVVASASALRDRFANRSFDYDYPNELVAGTQTQTCCGWQTYEEGEVIVTLHSGETRPAEAVYIGAVQLASDQDLLVLPYSQLTYCCDSRKGEPEEIEGLCARFAWPAGRYSCHVRVAPVRGPSEKIAEAPLAYNLFLTATTEAQPPVTEPPVIERFSD